MRRTYDNWKMKESLVQIAVAFEADEIEAEWLYGQYRDLTPINGHPWYWLGDGFGIWW